MSQFVYTVSSLVHYLKEKITNDIQVQGVLIKGEISNFTNHRSGHWYFTLKDSKSRISCVMFSSYANKCPLIINEGMKVIVSASLSVYEPQGSCQLYVTQIQSDGLGDLFLQYEQLKQKLSQEGYFNLEHKKKLPSYPEHIILISGKESAALQDMKITLKKRWPIAKITFFPTLVQGQGAAKDIIQALLEADQMQADIIILARGGGSIEDLWCFNDEQLAKTIYHLKTAIVTGVGHESDTTLVDYVSDCRAATPTAAIQVATPDLKEVRSICNSYQKYLEKLMVQQLQAARNQFHFLHRYKYFQDPLSFIQQPRLYLAMHMKQLESNIQRFDTYKQNIQQQKLHLASKILYIIKEKQQNLQQLQNQLLQVMNQYHNYQIISFQQKIQMLNAFSPLNILKRGYQIVYDEEKLIKSIHDITTDNLKIVMHDGVLHTKIINKEELLWNKRFDKQCKD